jgi:ElaB/YqjD/DUF883 family membrane-anchored ribosome-binding protein
MTTYSSASSRSTDADKGEHSLRDGLTEVKKDAAAVKKDLAALKTDAARMASDATSEAVEAVRCGAESASELAKSVGDRAQKMHSSVREHVIARPTTSILIALGVGVVAGKLLARR